MSEKQSGWDWFRRFLPANKQNLDEVEGNIMEAIQSFAGRVKANFEKLGRSVDGVVTDIEQLKKKIEELQASPGALTPEDQTALNEIETLVGNAAAKVEALDAATEPTVAPVPTP